MAVIPTATARRSLDTGRGSIPNTRISDAPGRALQSVGNALTAFAARAEEQQSQMSAFKAQSAFVDLQGQADVLLRESQANLIPGAENFHDDVVGKFDELASNFTSGITDPRVRERAEIHARRFRNQFSQRAASVEATERNRFFNTELDRLGEGFLGAIDQNPGDIGPSIEQFTVTVEDSGLPPVEKQQKIRAFRELAVERALQAVGKNNPALAKRIMNQIKRIQAQRFGQGKDTLSSDQRVGLRARKNIGTVKTAIVDVANNEGIDPLVLLGIAKIESGFNPKAKNPRSSAAGVFQFVTSTGRRFGLPKNAASATIARQTTAGGKLTAENISGLKSALGRNPTPGETYMAHFLGLGGARNVLSSGSGADLRKALGANAGAIIRANPFMRNMKTVGDLVKWADRKMLAAMRSTANLIEGGPKTLPTFAETNAALKAEVDPNTVSTAVVPNQVDPTVVQFTQVAGQTPITQEDPPERFLEDTGVSAIAPENRRSQELLEPETIDALTNVAARIPNLEDIPEAEINQRSIEEPEEFLDEAVEAIATIPETALPEEAQPILFAASQGEVVLGADAFDRVKRVITTSDRAIAEANDDLEREQGDAIFKDLLTRSARGQLTLDEVEANKDFLSTSQFSQLIKATTRGDVAKKSDPTVFADLMVRADEDPEGVQRDALQAFQNGLLTQQDFNRFFTITRSVERQRPVWFKSVKDFVRFSLKPPDPIFDLDGSLARKQQQAVLDFEQFFLENPDVTFEDARKRAEELVGQSTASNATENKSGTKGVQPPPFVSGEVTPEKLRESRQKITDMLNTNQITREEANKLGRDLMIWFNIFGLETGAE